MGDRDAGEDRCCQQPSRHPVSMPQGLGPHSPIERFDNEARSPQTHSPLSRGATEQPPHSLPKRLPLHSSSAGHTGPRHRNNHTLPATSSSGIPLRSPTPTSQSPDFWQAESAYTRIGPGRGGDERGGGDEHVHTGGGLRAVGLSGIVDWSETTNPKDGDGSLIASVHRSSGEVCHHRGLGKEHAAGAPLRHRRPPMRRTDERNSDSGLPHCHARLSPPLPEATLVYSGDSSGRSQRGYSNEQLGHTDDCKRYTPVRLRELQKATPEDIGLVEPPINRLRRELSRPPWGFTKINYINEGEVQTSCTAAKEADLPVENSVYSLLREAFESLGVRCYDLALHSHGFDCFVKHCTVYTQTFLHPQREIFADEIYIGWRLRATFHRCTGRMGKCAGGWIHSLVAHISWW